MTDNMNLRCPGDVIVIPAGPDCWIAYNVFARTSLALNSRALDALGGIERENTLPGENGYVVWEIEWFSNSEGLLADPTRIRRNIADLPAIALPDRATLERKLQDHSLLIGDEAAYRARFAPKRSLIDRMHLGNFHQQVGHELQLKLRQAPSKWWLSQKFTEDLRGLRDNLYGAVQGHALPLYIQNRFHVGQTVVDIGCGPGFYSNLIANTGAKVIGLDPNKDYIEIARRDAPPTAHYEVADIGTADGRLPIEDESADAVFISDTMLFYFVSPEPGQIPDLDSLLVEIKRILRPNGRLICVEPHYLFWLAPWLGDVDRPFTILSEYRNRQFTVTPTFSTLFQSFARNSFAMAWMEEFHPNPSFEKTDPRAFHFAMEFPVWHLFEFAKLSS